MEEKKQPMPDGMYMGSVKVGAKGQIVIPKDVRDMFSIEPGEALLLLADVQRGIAIQKIGVIRGIADSIFKAAESDDGAKSFAATVTSVLNNEDVRASLAKKEGTE